MFRSPIENLPIEALVWKIYGLFDTESGSLSEKKIFKAYVLVTQALFIYGGIFIQVGTASYTDTIEEDAQALCVSCAYVKAACKAYIFVSSRNNAGKLWAKLDADVFKTSSDKEKIR